MRKDFVSATLEAKFQLRLCREEGWGKKDSVTATSAAKLSSCCRKEGWGKKDSVTATSAAKLSSCCRKEGG